MSANDDKCQPCGNDQITGGPGATHPLQCSKFRKSQYLIKDLGHSRSGYIRMLGQLQMSAHLVKFDRL